MLKERVERKLEKSGRITPREVLEAYEETGLEPIFDAGFRFKDRACAISALMELEDISMAGLSIPDEDFVFHMWAQARLGNSGRDYAWGFTNGFDGLPKPQLLSQRALGWLDGQRTRKFVLARYPDAG